MIEELIGAWLLLTCLKYIYMDDETLLSCLESISVKLDMYGNSFLQLCNPLKTEDDKFVLFSMLFL